MNEPAPKTNSRAQLPTLTVVIVVYNRREELRFSLKRMLESDYDAGRLDVIVVDNASHDGSADMVREEFPEVQVIARDANIGAPAWNDGFALAEGDFVLILDDDCYLPPDGLRRAATAAEEHGADLVSFSVVSTQDAGWKFSEKYRTGLLTFWGCAALVRRKVLDTIGGYDPAIFIWANELELTIRLLDYGGTHLHLPEIVAQHMKAPPKPGDPVDARGYRVNARHFAYVAAKLLRPGDAAHVLLALLARNVRDGVREYPHRTLAVLDTILGFRDGLRRRQPVKNAEISRTYRENFQDFASPWMLSRKPQDVLRTLPSEILNGRREQDPRLKERFFEERREFYPESSATLRF